MNPMKVLILGGYGVFGGRLAVLLADIERLELIIAGRDLARAEDFCRRFQGRARVTPLRLDRCDILDALRIHRPDLVVDASGPFQDYGEHRYRVIEACIDERIDYLDFADAADFVFGVAALDQQAKQAGIVVLSGVSSFPVLTAAVLRHMAKTMEIISVEGGIAPSPYAGIGLNVMRAVVGYAGAPVTLRRQGREACGVGLAESMRFTVAVPGRLPLRNIRFSLVDVPDLRVIPPEYPAMTDIWMGAGPVPEVLHRILNVLARVRHRLRLPSLVPFAGLFYAVLNRMKYGEHRGGMFIRARGRVEGQPVERSWHLLAEGDDGPFIPSMAIEAIVRQLIAGERPANGARPATHALELSDYDALFGTRSIFTGFREDDPSLPLYPALLGPAFAMLPPRVRELHGVAAARYWSGNAEVTHGAGLGARLVRALVGFPQAAVEIPVLVAFAPEEGGARGTERWTRTFGHRAFSSTQCAGSGRSDMLLVERFGVVSFAMALVVEADGLHFVPRRWSLFGVPMPASLLPRGRMVESEEAGRFRFHMEIVLPFVGLVVAYCGLLDPEA